MTSPFPPLSCTYLRHVFFMQLKAYKPILVKMTKKRRLRASLQIWKDPMMTQQKTPRLPTKRKQDSKENIKSPTEIMGSLQQLIHTFEACSLWCEAMKPAKQFRHIVTKHPSFKDKPLEFFERKKCEHKRQKQLLKATTSSNVSALRASISVANHIVKA